MKETYHSYSNDEIIIKELEELDKENKIKK